jgi:23S rRNA (cytosine1962-C5)-methyltransferase
MANPLEVCGEAVVTSKGASRLAQGHPWVYQSDVAKPAGDAAGVVLVADERGKHLGLALYSPRSLITLRLLSTAKELPQDFVATLVANALERRRRFLPAADAYRWVHGEGDGFPSVFVDRYGDCVSLQILSGGGEVLKPLIITAIIDQVRPRALVVRDDATSRQREGLGGGVHVVHGEQPVVARYHEGELELEVDLCSDQKTGSFLDQADNHLMTRRYARGRALDCFTYHGGFALQMAPACAEVTGVDQSEVALGRARANAERAGLTNLTFVRANVFDLLPELVKKQERYDTIVLDPPAFASNKASEPKALAAYREINRRALGLLRPGGVLITCSCSGRITPAMFDDVLDAAARDARRSVQILERRGAGVDHPVLTGVPETEYLKCRVLVAL